MSIISILLCLLVFLSNKVLCEEEPQWPDLRCHLGYVNATENVEIGQGRMFSATKYCEYLKDNPTVEHCFKRCMLEETSITKKFDTDKLELMDEAEIAFNLQDMFFTAYGDVDYDNENQSAKDIANRLVSMCSQIINDSEHIPCAEKSEVYACLENAWAC